MLDLCASDKCTFVVLYILVLAVSLSVKYTYTECLLFDAFEAATTRQPIHSATAAEEYKNII